MAYVRNLEISVPARQFDTTVRIDRMNNTRLWLNDVECEPSNDDVVTIPAVVPGDLLQLETRSSGWWGNVVAVDAQEIRIAVQADGHFESIRRGLSGLLTFNIRRSEYATVESSLHSEPVRWDIYIHTKAAANCAASDLDNEQRNEIWRELLAICAKTSAHKPLPEWWGKPEVFLNADDAILLGESTLAKLRGQHD